MKRVSMRHKLAFSTTCTTWRSFPSGARGHDFCIVTALELRTKLHRPHEGARSWSTDQAQPRIQQLIHPYLDYMKFGQLPINNFIINCFMRTDTQHHALPTSKAWKGRCPACHASSFVVESGSVALLQTCEHTCWVHAVIGPLCPPG